MLATSALLLTKQARWYNARIVEHEQITAFDQFRKIDKLLIRKSITVRVYQQQA